MMQNEIQNYQTLVFDCDGVVLNSNQIKTDAFYEAATIYGHEAAQTLKDYHVKNGGISRYKKFEYFLSEILGQKVDKSDLELLLNRFATEVKKGLLASEVAEDLRQLRKKMPNANWLIVSGGDQSELRETFTLKALDELFDGGIFGSPDTKEVILEREIKQENILTPALFLGDSKYDYQAANFVGLDFVFISNWSEVDNWQEWCKLNEIPEFASLKALLG